MKIKIFSSDSKSKNHQKGQSLVELAITLNIILLLLAGAFDFGSALLTYISLRDAAQEGVLYGSIEPVISNPSNNSGYYFDEALNTVAIINRIQNSASKNPIDLNNATIGISYSECKLPNHATGTLQPCPCAGISLGTSGEIIPNSITVTVSYNYHLMMPFLGTIIGTQVIPITATVTDVILRPACRQD